MRSITPAKEAVADDSVGLPDGGFLVSLMGNKQGACAHALLHCCYMCAPLVRVT
jgi:hypothetical protein